MAGQKRPGSAELIKHSEEHAIKILGTRGEPVLRAKTETFPREYANAPSCLEPELTVARSDYVSNAIWMDSGNIVSIPKDTSSQQCVRSDAVMYGN
jgi:hypothetical protein